MHSMRLFVMIRRDAHEARGQAISSHLLLISLLLFSPIFPLLFITFSVTQLLNVIFFLSFFCWVFSSSYLNFGETERNKKRFLSFPPLWPSEFFLFLLELRSSVVRAFCLSIKERQL